MIGVIYSCPNDVSFRSTRRAVINAFTAEVDPKTIAAVRLPLNAIALQHLTHRR